MISDLLASDELRSALEELIRWQFPDPCDEVPNGLLFLDTGDDAVVAINPYHRQVIVGDDIPEEFADEYATSVINQHLERMIYFLLSLEKRSDEHCKKVRCMEEMNRFALIHDSRC
ncbi:hypothetical protein HY844_00805 [Candidatus Berkelbacteria bacterium]|nr:hypothetical protein [Candidatus Berkelbacteria bacterium]